MNETQEKSRTLASFTSMFEEIKNDYKIDILKYDSFENFMIAFSSLLNKEELNGFPIESFFIYK